MTACRLLAAALAAAALALATVAEAGSGRSGSSGSQQFCDRSRVLSASEQDSLLRFAAVVRDELASTADGVALVSRSGLDLSQFGIRYSHAAIAWRSDAGGWKARQLYYACDEGRPRLYDQGVAGFVMGTDDAMLGYVSIVTLPSAAAARLRRATLDTPHVLRLLATDYSANAFAFGLRYQNCNQWVVELLATAWGGEGNREDPRASAQQWLRSAGYAPQPVPVTHGQLFASAFVPLVHVDDHPEDDRFALALRISLPSTIEAFVRQQFPASERIGICHDDRQIVVHRGWNPAAEGCRPMPGDRVIALST